MVYISFPLADKQLLTDLSLTFLETPDALIVDYAQVKPHIDPASVKTFNKALHSRVDFDSIVFTSAYEALRRVA